MEPTTPEWLKMRHMSVLGACWHMAILRERSILGDRSILDTHLFWEEKVYFWSARLKRKKRNMQKMKEKEQA
jgi:hypothetical protein